jgi:hypothetical protein
LFTPKGRPNGKLKTILLMTQQKNGKSTLRFFTGKASKLGTAGGGRAN